MNLTKSIFFEFSSHPLLSDFYPVKNVVQSPNRLAQSHEGTEKSFFSWFKQKTDLYFDLLCVSVPPCDAGFDLDFLGDLGVLCERLFFIFDLKTLSLAQSHEGTEKRFLSWFKQKTGLYFDLLCVSMPPCEAGFDLNFLGERPVLILSAFVRVFSVFRGQDSLLQ